MQFLAELMIYNGYAVDFIGAYSFINHRLYKNLKNYKYLIFYILFSDVIMVLEKEERI